MFPGTVCILRNSAKQTFKVPVRELSRSLAGQLRKQEICTFAKINANGLPRNGQARGSVSARPALTSSKGTVPQRRPRTARPCVLGTGVSVQSKPGWAVSPQVAWGPERSLGEPSFPPGWHISPAGPSPQVREQGQLGTWEWRAEGSPPPEALNLPRWETELDSVRFQREFGQRGREASCLVHTMLVPWALGPCASKLVSRWT